MEEQGLLDPSNEVDLAALHFVYLPRIQISVNHFADCLRNRPLRTERGQTPMQLWLKGYLTDINIPAEQLVIAQS